MMLANAEPIKLTTLEKIDVLERSMSDLPQVEITVKHHFADGLYSREMFVPAGVIVTSMIHKKETLGMLTSGEMLVWNDAGEALHIKAPFTVKGKPGTKRVGYAITNSVWSTIHRTDLTDLEEIEKEQFVTEDCTRMFDFATGRVLDAPRQDRADFELLLSQYGIDRECVRAISENTEDRVNIDISALKLVVSTSPIAGDGIFCMTKLSRGAIIGPGRLDGRRTQLGRYTNHSANPNATVALMENTDVYFVALRDIENEEVTIDYRQALGLASVMPLAVGG